jgi:hypothetical protein
VLTVNPAITYGVFERVKALVLAREGRIGGRLRVGESFWIGVASKTLATVVTYPYIFVSYVSSRSCILKTLGCGWSLRQSGSDLGPTSILRLDSE